VIHRLVRNTVPWLIAGAMMTVAVAWACALWAPAREFDRASASNGSRHEGHFSAQAGDSGLMWDELEGRVPTTWPRPTAPHVWWQLVELRGPGLRVLALNVSRSTPGAFVVGPDHLAQEYQAGWPMTAFSGDRLHADGLRVLRAPPQLAGALAAPAWLHPRGAIGYLLDGERMVPLRPLWMGLGVNAVLYGAALWCVARAGRGVRAWDRRRRGACGGCGYDLRGIASTLCPECGTPLGMT
jgi:hypothetical protein